MSQDLINLLPEETKYFFKTHEFKLEDSILGTKSLLLTYIPTGMKFEINPSNFFPGDFIRIIMNTLKYKGIKNVVLQEAIS